MAVRLGQRGPVVFLQHTLLRYRHEQPLGAPELRTCCALHTCRHGVGNPYPIRNPSRMPLITYSFNLVSGCSARLSCHVSADKRGGLLVKAGGTSGVGTLLLLSSSSKSSMYRYSASTCHHIKSAYTYTTRHCLSGAIPCGSVV